MSKSTFECHHFLSITFKELAPLHQQTIKKQSFGVKLESISLAVEVSGTVDKAVNPSKCQDMLITQRLVIHEAHNVMLTSVLTSLFPGTRHFSQRCGKVEKSIRQSDLTRKARRQRSVGRYTAFNCIPLALISLVIHSQF